MKKVFSALLLILFLPVAFQQVAIIMHFKLNQENIERKYCINKSSPKLQCHGNCYLKKELKEAENTRAAWADIYKNIDIVFATALSFDMKILETIRKKKVTAYKKAGYKEPYIEIFLPPPIL